MDRFYIICWTIFLSFIFNHPFSSPSSMKFQKLIPQVYCVSVCIHMYTCSLYIKKNVFPSQQRNDLYPLEDNVTHDECIVQELGLNSHSSVLDIERKERGVSEFLAHMTQWYSVLRKETLEIDQRSGKIWVFFQHISSELSLRTPSASVSPRSWRGEVSFLKVTDSFFFIKSGTKDLLQPADVSRL